MIKYLLILFSLIILMGCKSKNIDLREFRDNQLTSSYYNEITNDYSLDHWDYYMYAIESGKLVFDFTTAAFVYLISNVKIFDSRPEVNDIDYWDRVTVVIIIFRWSW